MISNEGDATIKSNGYRISYDSYADNIKHVITSNIEMK